MSLAFRKECVRPQQSDVKLLVANLKNNKQKMNRCIRRGLIFSLALAALCGLKAGLRAGGAAPAPPKPFVLSRDQAIPPPVNKLACGNFVELRFGLAGKDARCVIHPTGHYPRLPTEDHAVKLMSLTPAVTPLTLSGYHPGTDQDLAVCAATDMETVSLVLCMVNRNNQEREAVTGLDQNAARPVETKIAAFDGKAVADPIGRANDATQRHAGFTVERDSICLSQRAPGFQAGVHALP
jgi:hypothetical protein